ncbi:unnamed protein product, partial [Protopolystoma xenopodis]
MNGHSAIWFDSALKHGRSEACDTFDNPVLCGQQSSSLSAHSTSTENDSKVPLQSDRHSERLRPSSLSSSSAITPHDRPLNSSLDSEITSGRQTCPRRHCGNEEEA